MPYSFFQNNTVGTIISKLRCIKRNYEYLFFDLNEVFALRFFTILTNIIVLYSENKYIGIGMLIWIILFVLITFPVFKRINKYAYIEHNVFHDIMGSIANKITNILAIISFFSFKKEKDLLQEDIDKKYIPSEMNTYREEFKFLFYGAIIYVLMMFIIIYYVVYLKINHQITIGSVVLILGLTISISNTIWAIMEKTNDIVSEFGEIRSSFSIFNTDNTSYNTNYLENESSEKLILEKAPCIEFRNVTFSYQNDNIYNGYENTNNKIIFKNLNLTIKPGEKIGIIGESGIGKSSLFSLLLKINKPTSGEILINGVNIDTIPQEDLINNISFIPQDTTLFTRSIKDNLQYPNEDIDEKTIQGICKKFKIDEVIMGMPEKYNTIIGEGNGKISGGQRQRISIVRAFLKKSRIILLDEPTSALDVKTESLVINSLKELFSSTDTTVIFVSHRLYTVKDMDRIVLLGDEGAIIEEGTHEELMKKDDSYYRKLSKINS
jgi:ABC-type multidrug transport system fused ATPase/permease subunit